MIKWLINKMYPLKLRLLPIVRLKPNNEGVYDVQMPCTSNEGDCEFYLIIDEDKENNNDTFITIP